MLACALALVCLPHLVQDPDLVLFSQRKIRIRDEGSIVVTAPAETIWKRFAAEDSFGPILNDEYRLGPSCMEWMLGYWCIPLGFYSLGSTRRGDENEAHRFFLTFTQLQSDRTLLRYVIVEDAVTEKFQKAAETCDKLAMEWIRGKLASFDGARDQAEIEARNAWEIVRGWTNGCWIAEGRDANGEVVRACARAESMLGGAFVRVDAWEGNADALWLHSRSIYGLDPLTRSVHAWTFGANGELREASVHLDGTTALELRSLRASPRDPRTPRRIELRGDDARAEGGLDYKRMAELPSNWILKNEGRTSLAGASAEAPLKPPADGVSCSVRLGLDAQRAWELLTSDEGGRRLLYGDNHEPDRENWLDCFSPLRIVPGHVFEGIFPDPDSSEDSAFGLHFQLEPEGLESCTLRVSAEQGLIHNGRPIENYNVAVQLAIARARELAPYTPHPETIERLRSLVGATYEATTVVPTGETLRARTTWESWSHSTFVWHGRLGPVDAAELPEHTLMLYAVDPERGPRFWKFGADGSVATGAVLAHGPGGIAHDWHSSSPSGQERHIFVTLVPGKFDYRYVAQPSRSEATTLVDLMYVRQ